MNVLYPPPLSSSTKNRDSNIELLRIIAMFLVLVVHANFFTLGFPTSEQSVNQMIPTVSVQKWRIDRYK